MFNRRRFCKMIDSKPFAFFCRVVLKPKCVQKTLKDSQTHTAHHSSDCSLGLCKSCVKFLFKSALMEYVHSLLALFLSSYLNARGKDEPPFTDNNNGRPGLNGWPKVSHCCRLLLAPLTPPHRFDRRYKALLRKRFKRRRRPFSEAVMIFHTASVCRVSRVIPQGRTPLR